MRCPFCAVREKGLCQSVSMQDAAGSVALETSHAQARVFDAGEMVYAQGDPSDHVYNLVSGWIVLHRDMADGRRHITRFLLPGAMFGIAPSGQELGHTATALTSAVVCPIPTQKLDDLRVQVPSLNEQFILTLAWENHHTFEALATLGQGSARERIGTLLSGLATAIGGTAYANTVIRIPLLQRHIAEATGLTSIHVNRVLRQLREDLILDLHNGMLVIIDPAKLHALAEPGATSSKHACSAPEQTFLYMQPTRKASEHGSKAC